MRQPNILFLFPDQLRHDWTGANPDLPLRTPHLDALNARGTRFSNAVCPSPLCAPCRASIASGREYPRSPVLGNEDNLPPDRPTLEHFFTSYMAGAMFIPPRRTKYYDRDKD